MVARNCLFLLLLVLLAGCSPSGQITIASTQVSQVLAVPSETPLAPTAVPTETAQPPTATPPAPACQPSVAEYGKLGEPTSRENEYTEYESDHALLVLDLQENAHWQVTEAQPGEHWYQWLPDGRLLWIDSGRVFIANGDGSQKTALKAPEPISAIWINDKGQALANGKVL